MDNLAIDRILREDAKAKKFYQGVYSRDNLPLTLQPLSLYVLNLDLRKNPGSHWVLLNTINCPDQVEYFCSFGVKPKYARILNASSNISVRIIFNDIQVQHDWSATCGQHVLCTALLLSRGYNLHEIINKFYSNSLYKNDRKVGSIIKKRLRLMSRRRK